MSLPGDHSANGEPNGEPTPFRQLRAILGAGSEGSRSRAATRPPKKRRGGNGAADDGGAADPDTGGVPGAPPPDEAVGSEAAGHGPTRRSTLDAGAGTTKASSGTSRADDERPVDDDPRPAGGPAGDETGPRHPAGGPGDAGGPSGDRVDAAPAARGQERRSTTLTSDDVLDLMGGHLDGGGAGGNGSSGRGRGGWLMPLRTAPGTELDPTGEPDELDDVDLPSVVKPRRLRDRQYRRRHGVAPFVQPSARRSRRKRRRDYRKLGFIELSQEKVRLRHRIFPRTVLGISAMILAFGIGAALSGATLYAYYDYRLSQNETSVETFASGFDDVFASAISQLNGVRDQAVSSVNNSLGPLQDWQNDANAVVELPGKIGNGVWTLRAADTAGRPVVGSAFVVSSDASSSLLLTAHELVAAATAQPGPRVVLEKGAEQLTAEVWSWDPANDLALLKLPKGNLPPISWAPEAVRAAAVGTRVYALSGLGGSGAKAVGGMVLDQSSVGLQHNVQLSPDFRGGPLVTAEGQVLAVATSTYRPLGFDPGPLPYAPDVTTACRDQKVLVCPAALTGQR